MNYIPSPSDISCIFHDPNTCRLVATYRYTIESAGCSRLTGQPVAEVRPGYIPTSLADTDSSEGGVAEHLSCMCAFAPGAAPSVQSVWELSSCDDCAEGCLAQTGVSKGDPAKVSVSAGRNSTDLANGTGIQACVAYRPKQLFKGGPMGRVQVSLESP